MTVKDHQGLDLTGASPAAAELYQKALHAYHCFAGDGLTPLNQAIEDSPGFVMAHALKSHMTLVGADSQIAAIGLEAFEAAKNLPANSRERGHVAAIGSMIAGEVRSASRILEDVSVAHPCDSVALQAGQLTDFLLGDTRMLRDRIARALPSWSADMPNWHAVQGMFAFGLEECGQYDLAEAAGRAAVEAEPRDNWAQHAVAHVMIMQGRHADGVRWMRHENTAWQPEATLGVHNWWHTALFHLGLGEVDEALKLYDGPIYGEPTAFSFDLVDAAAMLWRLQLLGVDLGERWAGVADKFASEPHGVSAFVDTHAMLAYVGAGRDAAADGLLEIQVEAAQGVAGDNAYFAREVGLPACQAILAFGRRDYAQAVERLRAIRNRSARFGGSHAQRDVLDLTLIAAARRAGDTSLERALLAERAAAGGGIPTPEQALAA